MPLIARLGDPGSHGGQIITSAERTLAEGIKVARIGDIYACPIHGNNPIVSGATRSKDESPLIAYDGSLTQCGATIIATATRSKVE